MYLNDFCTVPMSLAGIPAISIPCGLSGAGAGPAAPALPVGFQIAGPPFGENALLDAAYALERAIGFDGSMAAAARRGVSAELEPVIGLEIHVQLATRTKMFCGCELSLRRAAEHAHLPGLPGAAGRAARGQRARGPLRADDRPRARFSELAPRSIFHRKNYFYPDLPKGYQISQYDEPLCRGGALGGVRIHRVHLEEDAAKLIHVGASGRIHGSDASIVDFNRGGTPLVEIVTEPDLRSRGAGAASGCELLRVTLRALGVSDVNMEEGSLRADANVSLRAAGEDALGIKTELKNLNSFRFLERGHRAPRSRASGAILEGGGEVDPGDPPLRPVLGRDHVLRSKEEAHDYRYFPEPDLLADRDHGGDARAARAAMPASCRSRARSASNASSASRANGLAARRSAASSATSSSARGRSRARGRRARAGADAREPGSRSSSRRGSATSDPAASKVDAGGDRDALGMVAARSRSAQARPAQVLDVLVARGRRPGARSSRARGFRRSDGGDELAALVARALAADPDAAAAGARGQRRRRSAPIVGT